jgi:outer membrane lipoprotein-sorting protein
MLTAIAALALMGQEPAANQVNPAELVSKMLAYYHDARTLTGSIVMTQKVGNEGGTIKTFLQFEHPNHLYIYQRKSTGDLRAWTVLSNGKLFAYNSPGLTWETPGKRLVEAQVVERPVETKVLANGDTVVTKREKVQLSLRDVYAAAAAGLGDRSTPLDIAISRRADLEYLRAQWKTVEYKGTTAYEGKDVHVVMGVWRPYGTADPEGQFRMLLTTEGELKHFARSQTVRPQGAPQALEVVTTWDVSLVKNGKPDPKLWESVK